MLRTLSLKSVYKSEYDNILEDFYVPALRNSIAYDRAVGFFSAGMLSYAAQGLTALISRGGSMRLIVGGELDDEDFNAMQLGYRQREILDRLGAAFIEQIDLVDEDLFRNRLQALSWLIAYNRLNVKIALRRKGMYHEKIGILRDEAGDQIVFQGSANESVYALLPDFNYESIHVFQCWRPELEDHFRPHLQGFERLWSNDARNTAVVDLPEAARVKLVKIAHSRPRAPQPEVEIDLYRKALGLEQRESGEGPQPTIPVTFNGVEFELREHQRNALMRWRSEGGGRGILALATGSGKTVTAIYGAIKVFETYQRLFLIVSVPYQNLADQWVDILVAFNIRAIRCYEAKSNWLTDLQQAVYLFRTRSSDFAAAVVVNRTMQDDDFQQLVKDIPGSRFLWIGDECHHHGAAGLASSLPANAELRLGLSATPEHYIDTDANQRLDAFYGKIVASYTLTDALRDRVLTPYDYHVQPVELTQKETEEYDALSAEIRQLVATGALGDPDSVGGRKLQMVLMKRARLLGSAENKLYALRDVLGGMAPTAHTLFYCGDGSVGDQDFADAGRQIEVVSQLVHGCGWKTTRFTSRENRQQRAGILENFRLGLIDAMVAIRCLDEGIDVPACRTAFLLASTRNPRQFVQRRGRILRRSAGKDRATIYDFLVRIPSNKSENSDYERNLLVAELKRVAEFSTTAMNRSDSYGTLRPLLREYDLEHYLA